MSGQLGELIHSPLVFLIESRWQRHTLLGSQLLELSTDLHMFIRHLCGELFHAIVLRTLTDKQT